MDENSALCETTKRLWRYYLLSPTEKNFSTIAAEFFDKTVFIGTGTREVYDCCKSAEEALKHNLVATGETKPEILDEWYKCTRLTDDVRIVYGGLLARQSEERNYYGVRIPTRFTVVYIRCNDCWKIAHIHHSVPYEGQFDDEYYSGTLVHKAEEAMELARQFKKKAESDLMTSVYNHEAFHTYVAERLTKDSRGVLYLFDLDFFKQCNDCFGHQAGDDLLKKFAELLTDGFSDNALVGRTGGDEFGVYTAGRCDCDKIRADLNNLHEKFMTEAEKAVNKKFSFSVGIAITKKGQIFADVFSRADKALYSAKNSGRNTVIFSQE